MLRPIWDFRQYTYDRVPEPKYTEFELLAVPCRNFVGHSDHFSRVYQHHPHPARAVCYAPLAAYADRLLAGAWDPML